MLYMVSDYVSDVKRVRVLLADDHPLLRHAMRNLLENQKDMEVVGEAGDGETAVKLALTLVPDIVVMDITMPKLSGLEATRQIKSAKPQIVVLILSVHDDIEHIMETLDAGAAGYLVKNVTGNEVMAAIRGVVTGDMVLSPTVLERVLKRVARMPAKPSCLKSREKLSAKEIQILKLAAQGITIKEIAQRLDLNIRTVKGHFTEIYSKMGVGSRTEAVIQGLRAGFLALDEAELEGNDPGESQGVSK